MNRNCPHVASFSFASVLVLLLGLLGCREGQDAAPAPASVGKAPASTAPALTAEQFVAQAASFNAFVRQAAELALQRGVDAEEQKLAREDVDRDF